MSLKLNQDFFCNLLLKARDSSRKRSHFNLHQDLNERVQRLCIGLKKGTYVRPHTHPQANKWELMLVLRGAVVLVIFDHSGVVLERIHLGQGESTNGIELKPNTWHTIFPDTEDAVILEVKEGPFTPIEPNDFASWAPEEGKPGVQDFLNWMEKAEPGERYGRR